MVGLSLREAAAKSLFRRVGLMLMVTAAAATSSSVRLPAMLTDKGIWPPVGTGHDGAAAQRTA